MEPPPTFSLPVVLPNSPPPSLPPPPRGVSTHFWWMLTSIQSCRLRSRASRSARCRAAGTRRGVSSTYLGLGCWVSFITHTGC